MQDNIKQSSDKKYLAYVRVSSKDQSTNWSPEIQEKQIIEYAQIKKLNISGEPFKGVESSFRPGRKLFGELVTKLKKEKLAGIIFATVDRSSRNYEDIGTFYKLIGQGYHFHFAAENLTTESEQDKVQIYDLWGQATVYSQRLKVKVNSAFDRMLEKGLFPTRAPIGYLNAKKGVKIPDPVQSKLIKECFEMYSTGLWDVLSLQKQLEHKGLRNPEGKIVNERTLYKTFRNRYYYGIIEWSNGRSYEGAHLPIISKALFDKVQSVLDKKSFKHTRTFVYVFQGMMSCPICGKPLRSISAIRPYRQYKYYNCRNKEHKFNLLEELVEDQFLEDLNQIEFSDAEVEMFLKAVGQFREDLKSRRTELTASLTFEIHKTEARLESIMDSFLDQKLTNDDFNQMKLRLLDKKARLNDQLVALQSEDSETIKKMENLGKLLKSPSLAYKTASEESRRRLVKSLCENFSWNEKKVITNWKKECLPISKRDKMLDGSATENRTPI
jgi:site-specific DNA recombinase